MWDHAFESERAEIAVTPRSGGALWRHLGASGGAFVDEFPGAAGIDFNCSMR